MIHPIVKNYLPQAIELFKEHKIKNAYVFGSVVTEEFNSNSDIDFLINFLDYSDPLKVGQSIWDLEDGLEKLTSRKIDLLIERSLKNPYFIEELNKTKELIYDHSSK